MVFRHANPQSTPGVREQAQTLSHHLYDCSIRWFRFLRQPTKRGPRMYRYRQAVVETFEPSGMCVLASPGFGQARRERCRWRRTQHGESRPLPEPLAFPSRLRCICHVIPHEPLVGANASRGTQWRYYPCLKTHAVVSLCRVANSATASEDEAKGGMAQGVKAKLGHEARDDRIRYSVAQWY